MTPIDTDYSGYVIWAYAMGAAGLIGVLAWTVNRLMKTKRKLDEAEREDAPGSGEP
jgi:hypothetical protein